MGKFLDYWNEHGHIIKNSDIDSAILHLEKDLLEVVDSNSRVYTAGNGGSAATAEHFAADLNLTLLRKNKRISAMCFSSQLSTASALANDIGYDNVFSFQARNHLKDRDIVILFTASGNSENILQLIHEAKTKNAKIHVFVGFDGGRVLDVEGINLIFLECNRGEYGKIENIHASMCHFIVDKLNTERV